MSTLKTAWLNLQDGLGKRFAWSHVKAIFYNYAEQKLLSTKLDEMDTAINSKVNKADIVQTESTATDKVPSAAYLKEIKDGLDNDIGELTSSQIISNGLHCDKGTIEEGGYTILGKLVIVNVRVKITQKVEAKTEISISGFPRTKIISANTVSALCGQGVYRVYRCYCTSSSESMRIVCAFDEATEPDTVLMVGCTYITV